MLKRNAWQRLFCLETRLRNGRGGCKWCLSGTTTLQPQNGTTWSVSTSLVTYGWRGLVSCSLHLLLCVMTGFGKFQYNLLLCVMTGFVSFSLHLMTSFGSFNLQWDMWMTGFGELYYVQKVQVWRLSQTFFSIFTDVCGWRSLWNFPMISK